VALDVSMSVVVGRRSLSRELENRLGALLDPRDRALCGELCYGLCRYFYLLSASLKPFLKKPLKKSDQDLQLIILMGMYQLRFMRVENHAAVNESVNLTLYVGKRWARGLVNGVLRNYLRTLERLNHQQPQQLDAQEHRSAYPDWLVQRMGHDWPQQLASLLVAGNQAPPMSLRVDLRRVSRDEYLKSLKDRQIAARIHPLVSTAVVLDEARPVDQLPGFEDGLVSVQDASAQLAADLLDLRPGQRVLDACAAPGGKTLHMLQSLPGLEMTALDRDPARLERVAQNLQRAGLVCRLLAADAADTLDWAKAERFDRILLDAPCSASGIIRRHPDIRILRQPKDIAPLVVEQRRLLEALWELLEPGGLLLYSTCSILKDENENQVAAFLEQRADCVERDINPVQWGQGRPTGRQILPAMDDMDGFYYALLEKTA
jgi:16S rRNA (cytosine967-C5)-methyltransferase